VGKKLIGGGMLLVAVAMIGRIGEEPTNATAPVGSGAKVVSTPAVSASPSPSRAVASVAPSKSAAVPSASSAPAASSSSTTTRPTQDPRGPLLAVAGVTDGDTIKVRVNGTTERVRVIGIDTPELNPRECYAQQAASRMQSLVQGRSVRLTADPTQADRDRYGRLLRHVWLADGRSVARLLIAGGYGVEYTYARPYAGQATYRSAQASAKAAHLGIWSAGCAVPLVTPSVTTTPPVVAKPRSACDIKGNISSSGEKIYHLPGDRYYDVTKISPSKGERWFCSESDAVNAGWRHAKV
jgi:micrococcal nuclease